MTTDPSRSGWSGVETGWSVVSSMIGGLITLGGLGYLIDRLVGTQTIFTGIGFVLGAGAGVYIIYLRYGRGGGDGDRT